VVGDVNNNNKKRIEMDSMKTFFVVEKLSSKNFGFLEVIFCC